MMLVPSILANWSRSEGTLSASASMVIEQAFDNVCSMTIEADADKVPGLREQFAGIDGTSIIE